MHRLVTILLTTGIFAWWPYDAPAQEESDTTAAVRVYPNPNDGRFFVSASSKILEKPIRAGLYDLTGQMITYKLLSASRPRAYFNLPTIPEGIYYLQARTARQTFNIRVVIH